MTGYSNIGPGLEHFGYSTAKDPWGPWSKLRPIQGVDINPAGDQGNPRGALSFYSGYNPKSNIVAPP